MTQPPSRPPTCAVESPPGREGRVPLAFGYLIVLGHGVVDQTRGPINAGLARPRWSVALVAWAIACLVGFVGLLLPFGRRWLAGRLRHVVWFGPLLLFAIYDLAIR